MQASPLQSYVEVVKHFLKSNSHNEVFSEACEAILRFTRAASMMPPQYGKALLAKAIRVGDVYDEGTLNDTFMEGGDELIRSNLRGYYSNHPQAIHNDMEF